MSIQAEWFKKGQLLVLRKNKSGCCCIIDDNDNIISACDAHQAWLEAHISASEQPNAADNENGSVPIKLTTSKLRRWKPTSIFGRR